MPSRMMAHNSAGTGRTNDLKERDVGTNYYWNSERCAHCGRGESKHIGKGSAGWCFLLHIYPDEGINDLPDWEKKWTTGTITNEYDDEVSVAKMKSHITERSWSGNRVGFNYDRNDAVPGPNGLVRCKISDWHCIGHGAGTWDLLISDFS